MKTIVYVDGYNLFYSLLSNTHYKWLDLYSLFNQQLIRPIAPHSQLLQVKYFTSPALGSMASDPKVEQRQARSHRAVKAAGMVEIIRGYHQADIKQGVLAGSDEKERVRVQVMEEKQTDVNISLHIYRDVVMQHCEQIVLCSNDADLEPALQMVKVDSPQTQIGLILPRSGSKQGARRSGRLEKHADWVRHSIRDDELQACQFPRFLLDHRKRTIHKPDEW